MAKQLDRGGKNYVTLDDFMGFYDVLDSAKFHIN